MEGAGDIIDSSSSPKRLKLADDKNGEGDIDQKDSNAPLRTLDGFKMKRLLGENTKEKRVCIEGSFESDGQPAVLIVEKIPFSENSLPNLFTTDTKLQVLFENDVYSAYNGFPPSEMNGIKVTLIHPATPKHIEKYTSVPVSIICESIEDYQNITLPYIESQKTSCQWVFNILEHKSESERIIYEDPDPETGFILLPDMKWNEKEIKDLYVVALCHKRDISSIRDLAACHLPLLKNIRKKGVEEIEKKYGLAEHKLRIYLHYQPTYYHLHVHFTAMSFDAPGSHVERAHLLDTVITNLELVPDYYQRANLSFTVSENDPLYKKYLDAGKIKIVDHSSPAPDAGDN